MIKQELLEALKQELKKSDDILVSYKKQYAQLESDIEYWERNVEALRTIVPRLGIEIAKGVKWARLNHPKAHPVEK